MAFSFSGENPVLGHSTSQEEQVTITLAGTSAATAGNYGSIFTASKNYQVLEVTEIHEVLGTDAGAVTLDITKDTGTGAPASGSSVLVSGTFNLKAANNTVQRISGANTANAFLARGQRLGLKDTGVLTAVAGVQVTITLRALAD